VAGVIGRHQILRVPFSRLQHRLHWNALFWTLTLGLVGAGTFFSVNVELRRAEQVVEEAAVIHDGDVVEVVMILNGDEIMVEKDGKRARVRMLGIHSFDPVVNERQITAFGHASVNFLNSQILNEQVKLVFGAPIKDQRGRYLAYVHKGGTDINYLMVEEGIAMVYTEYQTDREAIYLSIELQAVRRGRGIWGGNKSAARIHALRHEWANARLNRTGHPPPDYLLEDSSQ
jgi:endonuclease YncB( thermonuclease family)